MSRFMPRGHSGANSFLPEDYLRRKSEIRAIVISFILFSIVILGIVGAFFVTSRQITQVKTRNEELSRQYAVENQKIEQLKTLEAQKQEMIEKAEITTALIEKVPRSILLAELINRMPKELTLTELNLKSKRLDAKPSRLDKDFKAGNPTATKTRSLASSKPVKGKNADPIESKPPKPMPPRYEFRVEILGLSASDEEIADYHTALKQCPFLDNVELVFTSDVKLDDLTMRKFRIETGIKTDVDARNIEPLQIPRLPPRPGLATSGTIVPDEETFNEDPTVPNRPLSDAQNKKGRE